MRSGTKLSLFLRVFLPTSTMFHPIHKLYLAACPKFEEVLVNSGVDRVVRWCWENFQCRGVLLIWIRAYCTCSMCGRGLFGQFFSRLSFLFFLPLSGRRPDIYCNTVSKGC